MPTGELDCYYYTPKDVEEIKNYYFVREKWYELAIIAGIVLAFFLGFSI